MTRPAKPSEGRPKLPVFMMSVGAVAGRSGVKFKVLKTLNMLARMASIEPVPKNLISGNTKSLPRVTSTEVYPGPVNIFRQRQPGPSVVVSNSVFGLGKIPLTHCFLVGLVIAPPLYANGISGQ